MVAEPMCWVGGWLDQVGIRLTQLSTGLKVEAELGNKFAKKNFAKKMFAEKFFVIKSFLTKSDFSQKEILPPKKFSNKK